MTDVQDDIQFIEKEAMAAIAEQVYYCTTSTVVLEHLSSPAILQVLAQYIAMPQPVMLHSYPVDFRKATFIFTTRVRSNELGRTFLKYQAEGKTRNEFAAMDLSSMFDKCDLAQPPVTLTIPMLPVTVGEVAELYALRLANLEAHGEPHLPPFVLKYSPSLTDVATCLAGRHVDPATLLAPHGLAHVHSVFDSTVRPRITSVFRYTKRKGEGVRHVVVLEVLEKPESSQCLVAFTLHSTHQIDEREDGSHLVGAYEEDLIDDGAHDEF